MTDGVSGGGGGGGGGRRQWMTAEKSGSWCGGGVGEEYYGSGV